MLEYQNHHQIGLQNRIVNIKTENENENRFLNTFDETKAKCNHSFNIN